MVLSRRQEFKRLHPHECLDKEEFFTHYGAPAGYTREMSDHLFGIIDTNKNDDIDCDEYECARKILDAGNFEEKLKCECLPPACLETFYDLNGARSHL